MSTPDVRVRLAPEGIREVIAALRQVQQESDKANRKSAGGVGVVRAAISELKNLLPTLGLAATVAGFAALSRQALQTADATGKLQQRFGGATEEISGLMLAFRTNESNQAGLQSAFTKTAEVIGKLRAGSEETAGALAAIGVDAEQLQNLSTPRALESIAQGLAKIPPGAERAAAAAQIFGRNLGQELLPALDAVGEKGIDNFIEKAREMGVLIDDDLVSAAERANDALTSIAITAEGLATSFVAGLAPAVADAMETFNEAITGDGVGGMEALGKAIGFVIRAATTLFVGFGKVVGAQIAKVATFITSVADAARAIASGDLSAALESLRAGARQRIAIEAELQGDLKKLGADLFAGPKPSAPRDRSGREGGVDFSQLEDQKKVAQARESALQAQLRNELNLQLEGLRAQEQANKIAYDQGLQSLETYFARRRELQQRQTQAEIQALRLERQAVAQELSGTTGANEEGARIKLRQDLANLTAQIQVKELEGQRELAALEAERTAALKDLANEQRQAQAELAELEGDRHAAFMANLQTEIEELRRLGVQAGQTAEQINADVQRLTAARTSQFNFDEVRRRAQAALQGFDRDAEQIRRDTEAGLMTSLEGEERLIQLQRDRLVVLRQLADEQLRAAEATGNNELIDQARAYADSVAQIQASFEGATNATAQFRQGAAQSFQQGLGDLFANVDKIKNFEDALGSLADTVARELARIAGEILARQATLALLNSFFGASTGVPATGQAGGQVQGLEQGDVVAGPKLPIKGPDNIPALLQEGEFVVRKRAAQKPGALAFLRAFNAGMVNPLRVRRFAEGGSVGAAGPPAVDPRTFTRSVQQNITVRADREGQVSRLTLQQTMAAAARGITEANRRDN